MFLPPASTGLRAKLPGQSIPRQGGRHHMLMSKRERPAPQANRDLEGETAIVTGSTSGIGLGIARALAQRGANVVLNGFGDPGEVEIVRAALAMEHDVEVTYDAADMSKPEAIGRMIDGAVAHFGRRSEEHTSELQSLRHLV